MKKRILAVLSAITILTSSLTFNTIAVNAASNNEVTISSNSFDGGTDNGQALNYTTGNNGQALTIVEDSENAGNYYLNIPSTTSGVMQWKPQGGYEKMSQGWKGDKYVIEFDLRVPINNEFKISFGKDGTYTSGITLLYLHPNKAMYFADTDTANSVLMWSTSGIVNKWMNYKMELDLTTKEAKTTVSYEDKTYTKTYSMNNERNGAWTSNVQTPFDTIAFYTTSGASIALDNFSIKAISDPNSVLSASYTASEEIEVNFTYPIESAEISDFTVKDSENNVVVCNSGSLSSDGLTYTLTPENNLAMGSYTVIADTAIESSGKARTWETVTASFNVLDKNVISFNSFDGGTDNGQALNYTMGNNGQVLTIVEDSENAGNYYLNIPSTTGGVMQWKPQGGYEKMSQGWKGDKYVIEFDLRVPINNEFKISFGKDGTYTSGITLLYLHPNKAMYFADTDTANSVLMWGTSGIVNKWMNYKMELDLTTKEAKTTVSYEDKTYTKTYSMNNERNGSWTSNVQTPFDTMAFYTTSGASIDLDNFSVKAVSNPNSISSASYTSSEEIEVNFTYPIESAEVSDFTVKDSENNDVACSSGSLSSDGLTYTLTPVESLAYGTYTVEVSDSIVSVDSAREWEIVTATMKVKDPKELGYHTFDNGLDNGVALTASGSTAPSIQRADDGNYYLFVPAIGWSMSRWFPAETSDIMKDEWLGDTYTVDFDFMVPTLGYFSMHFAHTDDDRNGPNIFSYVSSGKLGFREYGGGDITTVPYTIGTNTWYHYTFELNIGDKTGKAILRDLSGTVLGETDHVSIAGEADDWWKSATKVPFSKLAFLPVAGELALDNVKFSRDYFNPAVSDEAIKILKNSEEQQWLEVSPLADTIEIDFGTTMEQSTLAENVYVTKKGEIDKLACVPTFQNKVCTLSVAGLLERDTDYEIHILSGVSNVLGENLGADKSFEFSTSVGEIEVNLCGIYKDNNEVKNFTDFNGDVIIDINYENTTGQDKEFYIVIAQYSADNMLVNTELAKVTRTADIVSDSIEFEYSVPTADGATSATVMILDSLSSLRPLDFAIDL